MPDRRDDCYARAEALQSAVVGGALITIQLNGEPREIPDGLTLAALIDWLKLPADRVAVERNLEIVSRGTWGQTPIHAGDRLEVVQFVGGGRILDFGF
jgi:thiamine biosynthesis protein ThiS